MAEHFDIRRERRTLAGIEIPVAVVPRTAREGYTGRVATGLAGLLEGMRLTLGYFLRPFRIVTRQYPENREVLRFPERYRAVVRLKFEVARQPVRRWGGHITRSFPARVEATTLRDWLRGYEDVRYHKCTGCGSCEAACPNGSIRVITRIGPETEERELDRFVWRMDSCMYCYACVQACSFDAIEMGPDFENAVYDRRLLVYNLNPVAGPPASMVIDEQNLEARWRLAPPRPLCGGPIPLNGHPLPNLRPLALSPRQDDDTPPGKTTPEAAP